MEEKYQALFTPWKIRDVEIDARDSMLELTSVIRCMRSLISCRTESMSLLISLTVSLKSEIFRYLERSIGRCENCQGSGTITIEMNFLPDVFIQCDVCNGKRFNKETLDVLYKGKSINDVLNMSIEEACSFFASIPHIARKLETLKSVGLGYIPHRSVLLPPPGRLH